MKTQNKMVVATAAEKKELSFNEVKSVVQIRFYNEDFNGNEIDSRTVQLISNSPIDNVLIRSSKELERHTECYKYWAIIENTENFDENPDDIIQIENPDDIIQIENPDLKIKDLSEQEILDYLLYHRNWLVLPSNTRKNFEDMFDMDLSGQKWKKFVNEITREWYKNGDENFVEDFMQLLVSKTNRYWD